MDQAGVLREMKRSGSDINAVKQRTDRKTRNERVQVIAITSGKGGVGKTNIAANLAYNLVKMGKRTLLLDADAGLANIDVILGIAPEYNLYHVLHGEKELSDVIIEGPGGVKILPAASGIHEMAELSKGQKFTLLDELSDFDDSLDFMFIDTGAGIAANVMYFNMVAKEIIVVVTPEPTSLTDAYALIKVLYQRHSAKRFMVLVNMARNSNEALQVSNRLSNAADHFLNLSIEYLGYIPYDKSVQDAVRHQHAVAEIMPYSRANKSLMSIAKKLTQRIPENNENGTIKLFGNAILKT